MASVPALSMCNHIVSLEHYDKVGIGASYIDRLFR
jgi:hypothetical protein